ncbi:hypothetical protein H0H81_005996 [Sphagnurus paluster]|uniref:Ricin B lectin domain-containing protein n=1 Tax=Sphagnurus paluster TaxID=117069 RepID=A0A9P7FXF6_9AGAR|nr:hypothetical protein H0H81_005996 [Sphagnurus paluster]
MHSLPLFLTVIAFSAPSALARLYNIINSCGQDIDPYINVNQQHDGSIAAGGLMTRTYGQDWNGAIYTDANGGDGVTEARTTRAQFFGEYMYYYIVIDTSRLNTGISIEPSAPATPPNVTDFPAPSSTPPHSPLFECPGKDIGYTVTFCPNGDFPPPVDDEPVAIHPDGDNSKCLDSGDATPGTPVKINECSGSVGQQWSITPGTISLAVYNTLSCVDTGTNPATGAGMKMQDCSLSLDPSQTWSYTANKHFQIVGLKVPDLSSSALFCLQSAFRPEKFETKTAAVDDWEINEIKRTLWRNNSRPSAYAQRTLEGLRASATAVIAEIDNDLLGIQAEVNRLLIKIRSLLAVRSHQENLVKDYSAPLSSVRLLPSDILVEIFKYVLPERLNSSPNMFPLALRCVCSAWREAVLAHPSLWNGLLPLTRTLPERDNDYIIYSFTRTPSGGLSFSIFSPGQSHQMSYPYIETTTVFRSISPFYRLLSKLEIKIRLFQSALPFLSLPRGSIPLLEEIRLEIQFGQVGRATSPWTVFEDVPCLRRVQFTLPPGLFQNRLADVLPWKQFTHVVVTSPIELPLFVIIMLQSTQLHHASFCFDVYAQDSESHAIRTLFRSPVQLASLSTLTIQAFSGNKADVHEALLGEIMSKLDLPALQKLDLVGLTYALPLKMTSIIPSRRHLTSLRSLVLSDLYTTIPELTEILSNCRALMELSLCLDNIGPFPISPVSILHTLSRTNVQDQTAPQPPSSVGHNFSCLTSFNFGFRCNTVEESKAVAAEFSMILSTWLTDLHRQTPLKKARFYISDHVLVNKPGHVAVLTRLSEQLHKWMAPGNVRSDEVLNLTTNLITDSASIGTHFLGGVL